MHKNPTKPTVIHFSPKMHAALKEIAQARGVSVTSLVVKACDDFVYGNYYNESAPYIREYPTVKPETGSDNGQ